MRRYTMAIVAGLVIMAMPLQGLTQETNYLILEDIGAFKLHNQSRAFSDRKLRPITPYKKYNGSAGVLGGSGHFAYDHNDVTYETGYDNSTLGMGVSVQITQHAGVDSDKWLLHEVEDGYRDPDVLEATLTEGTVLRIIDGNRVFNWGAGSYTWVSGSKIVVRIEYTDLTGTKPEPLDVVKAYLQKFPSSITLTDAEAKSKAHSETWIKDEMDRRLWLCDKWFYQLQLEKVSQNEVLQQAVKSMNIFLDYREKYYGIKATDEKNLLVSYLSTNNGTGIKTKLSEYKTWWTVNKEKGISL